MGKNKILVGSPVFQKPDILKAFLSSLKKLNHGENTIDYLFVDDNVDKESCRQLAEFQRDLSEVMVLKGNDRSSYRCDEESHYWNDSLMFRVAEYKNTIIQFAIEHEYDELFFVDSDLILHPNLILHLESRQKEIVSEIFWSMWHQNMPLEPNVWLFDEYDLVPKHLGEIVDEPEAVIRQNQFLDQLKNPGLYEVGGLGACTLIKRSALLSGVSFAPIKNLTIHGEDRFFCIRAAVLGIELYVDTCYPAYHIYRETDLAGVSDYVKQNEITQQESNRNVTASHGSRVTLSMIVKNEQERYLSRVLKSLVGHIDEAVIIDDASTDNTILICKEILGGIPLHIITNKESMFANEVSLRKLQWAETIKTNPDWILNLDADEVIEPKFWEKTPSVLDNPDFERCGFRLYDMWSETQYREDDLWNAHRHTDTYLLRYRPDFQYQWKNTPQHCGRFPANCDTFLGSDENFRIQHLGWAREVDRQAKFKRYRLLDPQAVYGSRKQYESILDKSPNLIAWQNA